MHSPLGPSMHSPIGLTPQCIFTKGKEYLMLSIQIPSLYKNGLGFKPDRTSSKCLNNKKNCPFYKCFNYNKLGHLETFYFDKLKRSKGNNLRLFGKTNTCGPKKILVPNLKP